MLTSFPKTDNNATMVNDGTYKNYNWTIAGGVTFNDVINYERVGKKQARHCVMCGLLEDGHACKIPNQNKDVCRICDSTYWFLNQKNVLVKFCKGCKTFFPLMNYADKPEASKCESCRRRGRDNYYFKKEKEANITATPKNIITTKTNFTRSINPMSGSSVLFGLGKGKDGKGKGEDFNVESLKRMRANTLSPEEFCTLVNTMTTKDDEGIDIQTLLEYGSTDFTFEMDDSRDNSHPQAEPTFVFKDSQDAMSFSPEHSLMTNDDGYDDEFAQIWDNDQDDDDDIMADMFSWLPELIISPPLSPTCSV